MSILRLKNLKSAPKTLVCVTDQFSCERLIKWGRKIANLSSGELFIVNVDNKGSINVNHEAIEYLFEISKQNDAYMSIIYSDNPLKAISRFVKQHKIKNIITGMPVGSNSVLEGLWKRFSQLDFYMVTPEEECIKKIFG